MLQISPMASLTVSSTSAKLMPVMRRAICMAVCAEDRRMHAPLRTPPKPTTAVMGSASIADGAQSRAQSTPSMRWKTSSPLRSRLRGSDTFAVDSRTDTAAIFKSPLLQVGTEVEPALIAHFQACRRASGLRHVQQRQNALFHLFGGERLANVTARSREDGVFHVLLTGFRGDHY